MSPSDAPLAVSRMLVPHARLTRPGWLRTDGPRIDRAVSLDIPALNEDAPLRATDPPPEWVRSHLSPGGEPRPEDLLTRLARLLQPPAERLFAPNGVLTWPDPLLPFQQDGVRSLVIRRELLLADDMGLGKTIQAIAAMRVLLFQRAIRDALVVCPASLLAQWRGELRRWAPELRCLTVAGSPDVRAQQWAAPAHVRLVGYETLRADVLGVRNSPVLRRDWDLVVLDEASRVKNREAAAAVACKRLRRGRRWALTGTPIENSLDDVVSVLDFLLSDPERPARLPDRPHDVIRLLRQVQLRRRRRDVLRDLPEKLVVDVPIELAPAQREAYERAENEGIVALSQAGSAATVTSVLELIVRLKQLCNRDPVSGESAKFADIRERLAALRAEGHRALVFSQFTDAMFGVDAVAGALRAYRPLRYTGDMTPGARVGTVERFVGYPEHGALLLSLRAGGVGLNLQAASYVFHLDRWWNPASEEQAESRAHRMGQPLPVTVYRYTCTDTIEERIAEKLAEKRALFHRVVDDVSLDLAHALSEADLFGLFGLDAPRTRS